MSEPKYSVKLQGFFPTTITLYDLSILQSATALWSISVGCLWAGMKHYFRMFVILAGAVSTKR